MAANYFLKFTPEIKGDATQAGYEGQIEVLSFSWGVSQAGGFSYGSGGTSAKANVQDLSISFRLSDASPQIMQACATGKHLDEALLSCLRSDGTTQSKYLEIKLTDVVISSYQTGGSGDDMPIESISLNFAKVDEMFYVQDDKGVNKLSQTGTWDQKTGTAA
jgi:type VI secretion system secreted protein Hcp